jgi:predicted amidohydrolase
MLETPRVEVACVQMAPVVGQYEANQAAVIEAVASAAADVVVVPELATSGYVFADAEEARGLARPAEVALAPWVSAAAASGCIVAGGFAEREGDALYNSGAIVDATGVLAVYRKLHLWDREQLFFTPGSVLPPVVDTALGRLALCICYDLEFPEVVRGLALRGAELVCAPTNWPDEGRPAGERPIEVVRAMAAASSNRVFIAAADRCGTERGVDWVGGSAILGPDGFPLAGPGLAEPAILRASLELAQARDKRIGERNDVLADRRVDLYGSVMEAGLGRSAGPVEALDDLA